MSQTELSPTAMDEATFTIVSLIALGKLKVYAEKCGLVVDFLIQGASSSLHCTTGGFFDNHHGVYQIR